MQRVLLATALLGTGLLAQGTGPFKNGDYLYLCGFADSQGPTGTAGNSFPVSRFKDLDGDGAISDLSELFPFLTVSYNTVNTTGSFISDMDWVQEGENYAFYIADSADGRITRGVDANNNGVLDPTEVTQFFNFQSGFGPDGIAVRRDPATNQTVVYVALTSTMNPVSPLGAGIHRLVDLNGDGDASDPGEWSAFVNAAASLQVAGASGNVTLVSQRWEQVHVLGDGTVVAYSAGSSSATSANTPDQYCWYAFTDNNGVASASVFFNPSRANGITTFPDFAPGGAFPQWDVNVTSGTTTKVYCDVQQFAQQKPTGPGPRTYYFGANYNKPFRYLNPQQVDVHGLFYKWLDADQDFRVDAGELSLYANFSNSVVAGVQPFVVTTPNATFTELSDRVFAMKATDGQLHICWGVGGTGPNRGYTLLEDLDSNGTISSNEAKQAYVYSNAVTSTYNAVQGPYIKDASAFDRGLMPGPFPAGLVPYGQGCPHPLNGLSPVCDAFGGAPTIGNSSFGLAVSRMPSNAATYLFIGFGRVQFPVPAPFGAPGCNLLTSPVEGFGTFAAAQDGVAAIMLPVPSNPTLIGARMNVQWTTISVSTGTLVMSNGLELTIQ